MSACYTELDGLHVRVEGDSANSLLFVHGYCCANDDWDTQIAHFRSDYTCAALDLPGHGLSTTPSPEAGDAMVLAAAAVNRVKQMLPGKVVVIGHSMGCKIVREAWRQDEDKVAGLVFVDGSIFVGKRNAIINRARATIEGTSVSAFLTRLVQDMFPKGSDPALIARVSERAQRLDHGFAKALFLDSVIWDMDHAVQTLREIDVPALAIQCMAFGADFTWRSIGAEETTPFMAALRALSLGGDARVLTGSGHFPMFDAADRLNAMLAEFCQRIPGFGRA